LEGKKPIILYPHEKERKQLKNRIKELELENQLLLEENEDYIIKIDDMTALNSQNVKKVSTLEARLDGLQKEKKDLQARLQHLEINLKERNIENEKLKTRLKDFENEVSDLTREINRLKEIKSKDQATIESLNGMTKKLESEINALHATKKSLLMKLDELESALKEKQEHVDLLKNEVGHLQVENRDLLNNSQKMQDKLNKRMEELNKKLKELENLRNSQTMRQKELNEEIQLLKKENEGLKKENDNLKRMKIVSEEKIKSLLQEKQEIRLVTQKEIILDKIPIDTINHQIEYFKKGNKVSKITFTDHRIIIQEKSPSYHEKNKNYKHRSFNKHDILQIYLTEQWIRNFKYVRYILIILAISIYLFLLQLNLDLIMISNRPLDHWQIFSLHVFFLSGMATTVTVISPIILYLTLMYLNTLNHLKTLNFELVNGNKISLVVNVENAFINLQKLLIGLKNV